VFVDPSVHSYSTPDQRTLLADRVNEKLKMGATDARGISAYIPIMNLMQGLKTLMGTSHDATNWILTGIGVTSGIVIPILKCIGIGVSIFFGPIGFGISFGLFAMATTLTIIGYGIAIKNPDRTFAETGYMVNPIPFCGQNFLEEKERIQISSALCELPLPNWLPAGSESIWPDKFMNQREELLSAGFRSASGPEEIILNENISVTGYELHNEDLGISFMIYTDADNNTYLAPRITSAHSKRMTAFASAACPWMDSRTAAFEAAFRSILPVCGDNVSITGAFTDGIYAQFLGLKYGCDTFCFNPCGLGSVQQQSIGRERMSANSNRVTNFLIPEQQTLLQRFTDFIDFPVAVITGYQCPGIYGRRVRMPHSNATTTSEIICEAFASE
jgi:hypothetical protein